MKEIKNYMHLYLGCQYRWKNEDGEWSRWLVLTTYQLNWIDTMGGVDIQLKLRPINDIKEEEKWSIVKVDLHPLYNADEVRVLLSKHFDLFGLIEAGLAIDATTLK